MIADVSAKAERIDKNWFAVIVPILE